MKRVLLMIMVLFIGGCCSVSLMGKKDQIESKIYSYGFAEVYNAALKVAESPDYKLLLADKDRGHIKLVTDGAYLNTGDYLDIWIQEENDKVKVDISANIIEGYCSIAIDIKNINRIFDEIESLLH